MFLLKCRPLLHCSVVRSYSNIYYSSDPLIVWDPYLDKNIKALEDVQKFALRICLKLWQESYPFVEVVYLATLMSTRQQIRLTLLYKIIMKAGECPAALELSDATSTGTPTVSSYHSHNYARKYNYYLQKDSQNNVRMEFDVSTILSYQNLRTM